MNININIYILKNLPPIGYKDKWEVDIIILDLDNM